MEKELFKQKVNQLWTQKCSKYDYLPSTLPPVNRIVVIGDIHGDMGKLKYLLRVSNVIDKSGKWIGKDTVIVQVGDQIDSCRPDYGQHCINPETTLNDKADDVNILYYMTQLHKKAKVHGGAVYSLVGNHELMNVDGDFTYVSYNNQFNDKRFMNREDRLTKFSPGHEIANFLACTRKMAIVIGSNLFVHAGILPSIVNRYNVDDLNNILSLYLLDELDNPGQYDEIFNSSHSSPLWNRVFGNIHKNANQCRQLMKPLKEVYKVGRIYVGHTPQLTDGIQSYCDNTVWLTDVGASHAFDKYITMKSKYNKYNSQVLEIINDSQINIIS